MLMSRKLPKQHDNPNTVTSPSPSYHIDIDINSTSFSHKKNNIKAKPLQWPLINSFKDNEAECNAIFGNGFSKQIIQCNNNISSKFKCYQNPISNAIYCSAQNLIIDPKYIKVSNGGEPIQNVLRRNENDEFPIYSNGAFNIGCKLNKDIVIPNKHEYSFYLYDIIQNIQSTQNIKNYNKVYNEYCDKRNNPFSQHTTLFLMRYEYANLYHTATDWYNVYQIIHSFGIDLRKEQLSIVWLDGHSAGALDKAWQFAFGNYSFIKELQNIKCFERAVFIPAGYIGGISLKSMQKPCHQSIQYVTQFRQWFARDIISIDNYKNTDNNQFDKIIRIGIICRMDYLAHPRNPNKKTSRKFINDEVIENIIKKISSQKMKQNMNNNNTLKIYVERMYLEKISINQQFLKMSKINVLIGVHGAGLTHLLFLKPNSTVIEIMTPSRKGNNHFKHLSKWCGHTFFRIESSEPGGFVKPNTEILATAVSNAIDLQINRHNM